MSRRTVVPALALAVLSGAGACGDRADTVVVGSKNFTEQSILGELVAQQLERRTDLEVRRRFYLGGTFVCHRALTNGEIDVYVEYTGTALTAILEREPFNDPDSVYRTVARAYADRFDLAWTEPLGFDNTFAILVRASDARRLGLETISDVREVAPRWQPGFGYEFMERKDGYRGLVETYDLEFGEPPRTMDLGLTYRALADGRIDVIAGNSTDGLIRALDLRHLEDDRRYFPPYQAAPVVRADLLARHPEVRAALAELDGLISDDEMRRLNYLVDVEDRDVAAVVREWIRDHFDSSSGSSDSGS